MFGFDLVWVGVVGFGLGLFGWWFEGVGCRFVLCLGLLFIV